jgi:hypothetical protein
MYIDRQIKSLLEGALLTGKDQWINIKETREKINEYINSKREFSVDELVGMVRLTDGEVMSHDLVVKELRFKLYFSPSSSEEIFKEMETLFKGHVMVIVRKISNAKFVIERASNPIK